MLCKSICLKCNSVLLKYNIKIEKVLKTKELTSDQYNEIVRSMIDVAGIQMFLNIRV